MTKEVTKEYLVNELGLPYEGYGVEIISDRVIDTSNRWSELRELIFREPNQKENQAWSVTYSKGKTELQYERPWEFDNKVVLTLVEKKEVLKTEWVAV